MQTSFRFAAVLLFVSLAFARSLAGPHADTPSLRALPLDDTGLVIQGTRFAALRADGLHFDRFDATILASTTSSAKVNPSRARTTSGVVLSLASRAPLVRLTFGFDPAHENRGSQFGLYRDGRWLREVATSPKTPELVLDLTTVADDASASGDSGDRVHLHEIVLPSWSNPVLKRLEISAHHALEPRARSEPPKIVFLGDSISHGVGQGSAAYKNFPFLASRALGMEGFNLAVGGGKISPPVAELLQHLGRVRVVWILVGYNNWQWGGQTAEEIAADYEALLATVRSHQPEAEIFCCTLAHTRQAVSEKTGVTVEAVRKAVAGVVQGRIDAGDSRLHLVHTEDHTDESSLQKTADPVHFSEAGAARFSELVVETVRRSIR
jgi:lysophospholipase L1-like esterase